MDDLLSTPKKDSAGTEPFSRYVREASRLRDFEHSVYYGIYLGHLAISSQINLGNSPAEAIEKIRADLGVKLPIPPKLDGFLLSAHSALLGELFLTRDVDNFLTYIVELLTLIFRTRPEMLKSAEEVRIDFVLEHLSLEGLIRSLVERRVDRLAYLGMRSLNSDLQKKIGFSLFDESGDLETAVSICEIRNLLVHNRGIISHKAAHRSPSLTGKPGDRLLIYPNEAVKYTKFIINSVARIDAAAIKKFSLPAKS